MSLQDLRAPQGHQLDGIDQLWEGKILDTATAAGQGLRVEIREIDGGVHTYGPCAWMPRGTAMPQAGARCLVAVDEKQDAWIVVWDGPIEPVAVWFPGDMKLSLQSADHGDLGGGRFAWLKLDGRAGLLFSDYPTLGPLAGTSFGGDGIIDFGLPDLQGRIALAIGAHPDLASLAASDGLANALRKMKHRHGKGSIAITTAGGGHVHTINTYSSNNIGSGGQIMRGNDSTVATRNTNTAGAHGHVNDDFSGEVGDPDGPLDAPAHQVAGRAWFVRSV